MNNDPHRDLMELLPEKEFFVGIDSDGCAFDTMEIKHKECFCPNFIRYFNLQVVSKFTREAWDFVNLYSPSRGCNRFHVVLEVLSLLEQRKEVLARHAVIPDATPLLDWTKKETKLGEPALSRYAAEVNDPFIDQCLQWSKAVNKAIGEMVYGIPPFPWMRESLEKLTRYSDAMVVSQTPGEALRREWEEHGIARYVRVICGQEYGTKTEHLRYAAKGKYPDQKILMIGDAPGDLKAAKANGVHFFPINPGHEEESWKRFYHEGIDRFFNGTFAGKYEEELIRDFNGYLPQLPPWKK
jgi:phosphoglycolate phosphatase-like HAD superfamily hydrolase